MTPPTDPDAQAPQRRPGGRSARVREAVHRAVSELVAERGDQNVSIAEVAERSGVHPATIYRRWGTSEELVLDVAAAGLRADSPVPDTGSLRGDLLAYATGAASSITRPGGLAFLRAVLAASGEEDTPGSRGLSHLIQRGEQLQTMLDRAADRSEPTLGFTDVLDGILAPVYLRVLFGIGGITPDFLAGLVDRTLGQRPADGPIRR